jgi:hypothetical protein
MAIATQLLLTLLLVLCTVSRAPAACSTAAECNDGNLCTTDSCDPVDGCINAPTAECGPRLDYPIGGKKIKIHIPPPNPDQEGIRLLHIGEITVANLPVAEAPGDPVLAGGSMRLFSTAGGFDSTYPLPASHWDYFPLFSATGYKGYQYKDNQNVESPIGMIRVLAGKTMKLKGKGPTFQVPLASNPDPVHVVLTLGNRRYCMSFGGLRQNYKVNQIFWGKDALAPSGCPCKVNADCDDGDATNGAEACSAGFCP